MRSLAAKKPKQWDTVLPQAEFAYNSTVNRSTGKSPFEIVYGHIPKHYLDISTVPDSPLASKRAEDFAKRTPSKIAKASKESTEEPKR